MNYYKIKWGKPFIAENGDYACSYSYKKVKSLGETTRRKAVDLDKFIKMAHIKALAPKLNIYSFPKYFKSEKWGIDLRNEIDERSNKYLEQLRKLSQEIIDKKKKSDII